MKIHWGKNDGIPKDISELITRAIRAGIDFCGVSLNSELCITFICADEIRVLNRDWRRLDKETDVLSFPGLKDHVGIHRPRAASRSRYYRSVRKPISPNLGDIVICLEVAARQADEYGHSISREMAFLAIHGFLHLIGYDHEDAESEKEMIKAQEAILKNVGAHR